MRAVSTTCVVLLLAAAVTSASVVHPAAANATAQPTATATAQATVAEARKAADAATALATELRREEAATAKEAADAKVAAEAAAAVTRKKRAAAHASARAAAADAGALADAEDAEASLKTAAAAKAHVSECTSHNASAAAAEADAATNAADSAWGAAVEAATTAVAEKRRAADLQVKKTGNSPADELQAEAAKAEAGMWALLAEWSASLATAVAALNAEVKEVIRKPPSDMDPAFVPFMMAMKDFAAKTAAMKMRVDLLKSAYDGVAAASQEPKRDLALDAENMKDTVAEIHTKAAARAVDSPDVDNDGTVDI